MNENPSVGAINEVAQFLAKQDLQELTKAELLRVFGVDQVDLLILLGNALCCTVKIAAEAFVAGIAKEFAIVGGVGHSTQFLREAILSHPLYHSITVTPDQSEAEILAEIAVKFHGVSKDQILLETKSANCGDNAVKASQLLVKTGRDPRTILLIQDPTMQLRTDAAFKKAWESDRGCSHGVTFINFAPFVPLVHSTADGKIALSISEEVKPVWNVDRFLSLLMGEIPRLHDNEQGYGPLGKGFIGHVDVPDKILLAFEYLLKEINQRR